ncbi:hypothetical protein [Halosimplex halobium]
MSSSIRRECPASTVRPSPTPLDEPEHGLSETVLAETDVLVR